MKALLPALTSALALVGAAAAQPTGAPPPHRPKLIVAISIDQFSWGLYQRYRASFTGGLRRLSDGDEFLGFQSHAATETCPGHSTLLTGDHPARTGIVANNWFDRKTASNVYCVSAVGVADPAAKTAAFLKVSTLGDWMRAKDPAVRVVAVSGKDRAAIMMGGHHASDVYWWDDGRGFTSSARVTPPDPAAAAAARSFNARLAASWTRAAPDLWPGPVPERCRALQAPISIGRITLSGRIPPETAGPFPKGRAILADDAFAAELRASPVFDPMTLRFAAALVAAKRLGRGPSSDLLAVSLSATDHIGHRYGAGGPEMCVQMASVDQALGEFFHKLDALGISYVVALAADHGGVDAAERLSPPGTRVDVLALDQALSAHLRKTFDLSYDPLAGDDPRQVILDLPPGDLPRKGEMVADARTWLKARPEVADVYTADEILAAAPPPGAPPTRLTIAQRFHESFDPERGGDLVVNYVPRASLGVPLSPGANVAGHGSPYDYDREVPILFWWPGVARDRSDRVMETVDIAPTLASLVGAPIPPVDGKCVDLGGNCPR